jgi:hypothetical protein
VIGAGGKLGARAAEKIGFGETYRVLLCESRPERAESLREKGLTVTRTAEAMAALWSCSMPPPRTSVNYSNGTESRR